jgi:hypothetical protein
VLLVDVLVGSLGGGALVTKLLVKGWPHWVVIVLSSAFAEAVPLEPVTIAPA